MIGSDTWARYKGLPGFVLGFHGCDKSTADRVISGAEHIRHSKKEYDWLGSGAYFWESSPHRALEWATTMAARPSTSPNRVREPAVLGAIIDLGTCCNLFDSDALEEVRGAWMAMRAAYRASGAKLPVNRGDTPDRLGRYRDRATIEFMHSIREVQGAPSYDTVRAAFPEGRKLYPGAGFTERVHIQIAVRNPDCIKGYFIPIQS